MMYLPKMYEAAAIQSKTDGSVLLDILKHTLTFWDQPLSQLLEALP
jgi:hypothetical protein